jgi:hypothetical protein
MFGPAGLSRHALYHLEIDGGPALKLELKNLAVLGRWQFATA